MQRQFLKTSVSLGLLAALIACQPNQTHPTESPDTPSTVQEITVTYPETRKSDVVDVYFGQEVPDPYRWLEDDRSPETENWVKAQNTTTQNYLAQIPYKGEIGDIVKTLINYERVSAPFKEGEYTYFYKNDGLQNQSVLFRQKDGSEPEVFIDPNSFSEDGTISLSTVAFSDDGSLVAYQTSTGGSDWRQVYIMNVITKEFIGEPLQDVKFSGLSWFKNEGFYYSSYDKPDGSELSEKTDQHKLYYHKIGTPQSSDTKIFGHTEAQKHRYVGAQVSEDNRFLLISAAVSTSGNKAFLKDLTQPDSPLKTVKDNVQGDVYMLTSQGNEIYLVTDVDAPNTRVIKVSADNPTVDNWIDVIPETEHVLSPAVAGDFIFAEYMVDAISKIYQYDLTGKQIRTIALPGVGNAGIYSAKKDDTKTYFTFANYTTPTTIYSLDLATGQTEIFSQPDTAFNSADYVSQQVFYTSKDGTRVPMIITYHKDTILDGKNPTILYGYGGFNVSLMPRYSSVRAAWLALGGIYAVPNIRGGGEYGKAWHDAGTQMQKQNVFDDFIAAAEFLFEKNYTSSDYLALSGGSNGGLLVGAVMTQRPELAAVALPAVGVLDMLRYHTFTAGAGWAYDYGTSEQSKAMFEYLKGYSPLHNVAPMAYPATMVTTADHDDRVVPAHSFKFAATLQAAQQGTNPTLIRIEEDAGHGAGTPVSKTIEQYGDIYGFTLWNMGIRSLAEITPK